MAVVCCVPVSAVPINRKDLPLATSSLPGALSVGGGLSISFSGVLSISASGVTAGTYGDATHVGQFTVGADGRITSASAVAISGGGGSSVAIQTDTFSVSGTSYGLTTAPDGHLEQVTFDGILEPASLWSISGSALTISGTVDLTSIATVSAIYSTSATGVNFVTDTYSVSGTSYTLSHTPAGSFYTVYFDGVKEPSSTYTTSGTAFTISGGVNLAAIGTVTVVYTD